MAAVALTLATAGWHRRSESGRGAIYKGVCCGVEARRHRHHLSRLSAVGAPRVERSGERSAVALALATAGWHRRSESGRGRRRGMQTSTPPEPAVGCRSAARREDIPCSPLTAMQLVHVHGDRRSSAVETAAPRTVHSSRRRSPPIVKPSPAVPFPARRTAGEEDPRRLPTGRCSSALLPIKKTIQSQRFLLNIDFLVVGAAKCVAGMGRGAHRARTFGRT